MTYPTSTEETAASPVYSPNPNWGERPPKAGAQAEVSQDRARDSAKRKATEADTTLEGERPTSHSRKSQGGESKKEAPKATTSDSEKKKETLRAKQSSGHKSKGFINTGARHSN